MTEVRLGIVPLRPLTIPDLLRGSVDALRRNPGALLGAGLVVAVASEVAAWVAVTAADPGPLAENLIRVATGGLIGILLAAVVNTVVPRAVFGHTTTAAGALRAGSPALPGLLGVTVLTGLVVGGLGALGLLATRLGPLGMLLSLPVLLAVLYTSVALMLAPSAAVVERLNPVAAMRRSLTLVHEGTGGWWRVFVVALIAGVVGVVLRAPTLAVFAAISDGSALAEALAAIVVATAVSPWTMVLHALLYIDARSGLEGIDGLWRAAG
ncbi:hypothetical protein [Actinokineospora sp. NPDC004072]